MANPLQEEDTHNILLNVSTTALTLSVPVDSAVLSTVIVIAVLNAIVLLIFAIFLVVRLLQKKTHADITSLTSQFIGLISSTVIESFQNKDRSGAVCEEITNTIGSKSELDPTECYCQSFEMIKAGPSATFRKDQNSISLLLEETSNFDLEKVKGFVEVSDCEECQDENDIASDTDPLTGFETGCTEYSDSLLGCDAPHYNRSTIEQLNVKPEEDRACEENQSHIVLSPQDDISFEDFTNTSTDACQTPILLQNAMYTTMKIYQILAPSGESSEQVLKDPDDTIDDSLATTEHLPNLDLHLTIGEDNEQQNNPDDTMGDIPAAAAHLANVDVAFTTGEEDEQQNSSNNVRVPSPQNMLSAIDRKSMSVSVRTPSAPSPQPHTEEHDSLNASSPKTYHNCEGNQNYSFSQGSSTNDGLSASPVHARELSEDTDEREIDTEEKEKGVPLENQPVAVSASGNDVSSSLVTSVDPVNPDIQPTYTPEVPELKPDFTSDTAEHVSTARQIETSIQEGAQSANNLPGPRIAEVDHPGPNNNKMSEVLNKPNEEPAHQQESSSLTDGLQRQECSCNKIIPATANLYPEMTVNNSGYGQVSSGHSSQSSHSNSGNAPGQNSFNQSNEGDTPSEDGADVKEISSTSQNRVPKKCLKYTTSHRLEYEGLDIDTTATATLKIAEGDVGTVLRDNAVSLQRHITVQFALSDEAHNRLPDQNNILWKSASSGEKRDNADGVEIHNKVSISGDSTLVLHSCAKLKEISSLDNIQLVSTVIDGNTTGNKIAQRVVSRWHPDGEFRWTKMDGVYAGTLAEADLPSAPPEFQDTPGRPQGHHYLSTAANVAGTTAATDFPSAPTEFQDTSQRPEGHYYPNVAANVAGTTAAADSPSAPPELQNTPLRPEGRHYPNMATNATSTTAAADFPSAPPEFQDTPQRPERHHYPNVAVNVAGTTAAADFPSAPPVLQDSLQRPEGHHYPNVAPNVAGTTAATDFPSATPVLQDTPQRPEGHHYPYVAANVAGTTAAADLQSPPPVLQDTPQRPEGNHYPSVTANVAGTTAAADFPSAPPVLQDTPQRPEGNHYPNVAANVAGTTAATYFPSAPPDFQDNPQRPEGHHYPYVAANVAGTTAAADLPSPPPVLQDNPQRPEGHHYPNVAANVAGTTAAADFPSAPPELQDTLQRPERQCYPNMARNVAEAALPKQPGTQTPQRWDSLETNEESAETPLKLAAHAHGMAVCKNTLGSIPSSVLDGLLQSYNINLSILIRWFQLKTAPLQAIQYLATAFLPTLEATNQSDRSFYTTAERFWTSPQELLSIQNMITDSITVRSQIRNTADCSNISINLNHQNGNDQLSSVYQVIPHTNATVVPASYTIQGIMNIMTMKRNNSGWSLQRQQLQRKDFSHPPPNRSFPLQLGHHEGNHSESTRQPAHQKRHQTGFLCQVVCHKRNQFRFHNQPTYQKRNHSRFPCQTGLYKRNHSRFPRQTGPHQQNQTGFPSQPAHQIRNQSEFLRQPERHKRNQAGFPCKPGLHMKNQSKFLYQPAHKKRKLAGFLPQSRRHKRNQSRSPGQPVYHKRNQSGFQCQTKHHKRNQSGFPPKVRSHKRNQSGSPRQLGCHKRNHSRFPLQLGCRRRTYSKFDLHPEHHKRQSLEFPCSQQLGVVCPSKQDLPTRDPDWNTRHQGYSHLQRETTHRKRSCEALDDEQSKDDEDDDDDNNDDHNNNDDHYDDDEAFDGDNDNCDIKHRNMQRFQYFITDYSSAEPPCMEVSNLTPAPLSASQPSLHPFQQGRFPSDQHIQEAQRNCQPPPVINEQSQNGDKEDMKPEGSDESPPWRGETRDNTEKAESNAVPVDNHEVYAGSGDGGDMEHGQVYGAKFQALAAEDSNERENTDILHDSTAEKKDDDEVDGKCSDDSRDDEGEEEDKRITGRSDTPFGQLRTLTDADRMSTRVR